MSDDETPTRTIDTARIEDRFDDGDPWLVIEAAGDTWPVKWDRTYADGLVSTVMEYFGLTFDERVVSDLEGKDLPVKLDGITGEWVAVDTDYMWEAIAE